METHILLPMCLDTLSEDEWLQIAQQSLEYGFCLYDAPDTWRPAGTAGRPDDAVFAATADL
jgi:uncharacterized protein